MTLPSWNEVVEQWPLCCAKCGHALLQASPGSLVCPACTAAFPIRDHIAALLDLDANPDLREFTLGYQDIRRAEGYTGRGAAHYQALPDYPEGGQTAGSGTSDANNSSEKSRCLQSERRINAIRYT